MLSSSSHHASDSDAEHDLEQRLVAEVLVLLTPLWQHALRHTQTAMRVRQPTQSATLSNAVAIASASGWSSLSKDPLCVRVSRSQLEIAEATIAQALLPGGSLRAACEDVSVAALTSTASTSTNNTNHTNVDSTEVAMAAEEESVSQGSSTPRSHSQRQTESQPSLTRAQTESRHWSLKTTATPPRADVVAERDAQTSRSPHADVSGRLGCLIEQLVAGLMKVCVGGGFPPAPLISLLATLQTEDSSGDINEDEGDSLTSPSSSSSASGSSSEPQLTLTTVEGLATGLLVLVRGAVLNACALLTSALDSEVRQDTALEAIKREHSASSTSHTPPALPLLPTPASLRMTTATSSSQTFEQVTASLAEERRSVLAAAALATRIAQATSHVDDRTTTKTPGAHHHTALFRPRARAALHPQSGWWSRYASGPLDDRPCEDDDNDEDDYDENNTTHGHTQLGASPVRVHFSPADPTHVTLVVPATPVLTTTTTIPLPGQQPAATSECGDADPETAIAKAFFSHVAHQAAAQALRLSSPSPSLGAWGASALLERTEQAAMVYRRLAGAARHEPQSALFPSGEVSMTLGSTTVPSPRTLEAETGGGTTGASDADSDDDATEWFAPHQHPYLGFSTTTTTDLPFTSLPTSRKRGRESGRAAGDLTGAPFPDAPTLRDRQPLAWVRLGVTEQGEPGAPTHELLESIAPIVALPDATSTTLVATQAEVGSVIRAVDEVFSGRTILDASSWRYGRNRLPVAALSEVYVEESPSPAHVMPTKPRTDGEPEEEREEERSAEGRRVAFYVHETGLLYTNTGAVAALDVSDLDA